MKQFTPPPKNSLPPDTGAEPVQPASAERKRVQIAFPGEAPVVVYSIMAITIAIFLLQQAGIAFLHMDVLGSAGMKVNGLILQGQFWRFITPMFLHGSILHVGFNMYALYVLGIGLERHYGHGRFLILYLLSGFAGNVMSFLFSSAPSLGASTAIFGLLGAEGIFVYQNRQLLGDASRRALINIVTIAVINFIIGLSPGIDNWGHLGGLIGGTLFAWTAGPVLKVEGVYPHLYLVDERGKSDVVRATLAVGTMFSLLAAVTIYLRAM